MGLAQSIRFMRGTNGRGIYGIYLTAIVADSLLYRFKSSLRNNGVRRSTPFTSLESSYLTNCFNLISSWERISVHEHFVCLTQINRTFRLPWCFIVYRQLEIYKLVVFHDLKENR